MRRSNPVSILIYTLATLATDQLTAQEKSDLVAAYDWPVTTAV